MPQAPKVKRGDLKIFSQSLSFCWIKFDCFCYKFINGGFTFRSNLVFCFLGFLWFPCTLTQTKEMRRDADRPKGVSRVRQQFASFDFLRWPKSVTAISICSRQFQFYSRQFQFVHGNFNLLTAISICSRQFHFHSRQFQFHSRQFQFYSRQFQFILGNFNLRQFQFLEQ